MNQPDLSMPKRVHIIGIGGAGMAAIAEVLHGLGHTVSGSDLTESAAFGRLRDKGVRAVLGHAAENLIGPDGAQPDVVVRSTAIPDSNVEVVAVAAAGGVVLRRAEVLGALTSARRSVAVAGTHGKTTTSSMLAVIARAADIDPSFIIGGDVTELGTGAAHGTGDWFIVEADESDGSFLELGHEIGVVTNVEPDHLEHYGGEPQLRASFVRFVSESRLAVVCADDRGSAELATEANTVTYGQSESATYLMTDIVRSAAGTDLALSRSGEPLGRISVTMPGLHNALNATGATAAALEMGIPFDAVQRALAGFEGVGRRFQRRGHAAGITFIDDYAHLPTEVSSALDGATDLSARRVVAVFQPHRFSRTQALWRDFADAFDNADLLVLTDIYSSGEAPRPGVTGELIVQAVEAGSHPPEIVYHADRASLAEAVLPLLAEGDVCMTLGAGDLVRLPDELLALLGGVDG
jgi:UDP-N-acetylmuramate--alanine ligase